MELKCTGKTRLRTGHKTIPSLIRCVSLAEQPRENTNKYHYDATTRDKEPGGTNPRVVGVLDHTTGWTMQFRKPKNWNEPLSHDSFALLAPKNRNNRNQELEKKSVKEKPRILFSKIIDRSARAATGPKTIQTRRVPTHTSSTRSTKPQLTHGRISWPKLVHDRLSCVSDSFTTQ